MKKQTPDTPHAAHAAVVTGDESLAREWTALLEQHDIECIPAHDARALKAASSRLTAAYELTVLPTDEKKERLRFIDAHLPAHLPIISSSVTVTALAQSQWIDARERLIGFCGFPTLLGSPLIDISLTPYTTDAVVHQARACFTAIEKETVCIQDRTGMITPGIIAQVINEALMAVQHNVASAASIDTAMKLAAGYPFGPIEWGEKIGFATIAALLDAMRAETGEERFRTSQLLRQLAASGKFWSENQLAPEAPVLVQEELPLGDAPDPLKPVVRPKKKKAAARATSK